MTKEARNNAKVLYDLEVSRECVEQIEKVYHTTPACRELLESPVIPEKKKEDIIDRLFAVLSSAGTANQMPGNQLAMKNFLKVMCSYGQIYDLNDIFQAYYELWDEEHDVLRAVVHMAKEPDAHKAEEVSVFLTKRYPGKDIRTEVKIDKKLIGGMLITVGHEEYDWSYEGSLRQLERKLSGR